MKILLLFLCAALLTPAHAIVPDTIILNAGKNSKVIFYGKSAQDLKNLEMLDLNKIIRELNQRQNGADTISRQLVKLDEKGYLNPSLGDPKISWKQKYMANTYLNLYVGRGNDHGRYIFFQPPPALLNHQTAKLTSEIIMQNKLSTSLAVVHDIIIADGTKYTFGLRYGLGVGFNLNRYVHWTLLQSVGSAEVVEIAQRSQNLIKNEKIEALQSDFSAFQSYFQIAPKLSIKNLKGQTTFFLSAGARLNYDRFFENVNPAAYSSGMSINSTRGVITTSHGPVISGGRYSAYSEKNSVGLSYMAEVGYKWIGIFVNLYPENVILTTRLMDKTDRPESGFVKDKKGKIGYISFGIKLGR
ncbi:hypothetical protein L0657_25975 [Dyadobacter sp. CY345]|uniref:hypothetical protein n=1 Tax=Dyadobacter sp. CY345 TaxID=2909335 RepID=UPI001F33F8C7|nr:hypothetical protein [Dyadobacter sp. CY345]MCF2447429.1 hypothetical protein [Dyadobacter sp. CY345]